MSGPINPPPVSGDGGLDLPAYVSNGLIGLRVRCQPLQPGMALVSGYAGEDPERRIEAAAPAPYPLAGDLCLDGVWLSDLAHQVSDLQQAYDFACGELTSSFVFAAQGKRVACTVLTFASREDPTLVCQEITLKPETACDLKVRVGVSTAGVAGQALGHLRHTPGEAKRANDGALLWESPVASANWAWLMWLSSREARPLTSSLSGRRSSLAA